MSFLLSPPFNERLFSSFANVLEVEMVVTLIKLIKAKLGGSRAHNIGIITPYNAQKRRIVKALEAEFRTDR